MGVTMPQVLSNPLPAKQPPKLLEQVRAAIRTKHYSRRTEQAYSQWIKRFIFFHGKRHPREMGACEVNAFFSHLAVKGKVAASTQNQAMPGILFLYNDVLQISLGQLGEIVRAKKPKRLPVVLTRAEVKKELLPVPYYLLVFTLPHRLNYLALYNKQLLYDMLYQAMSYTLRRFGRDPNI